jgi:hypothetical protein
MGTDAIVFVNARKIAARYPDHDLEVFIGRESHACDERIDARVVRSLAEHC